MPNTEPQVRRANVLEIIGAWLHVWTPPRDAYVPPVPWKKLAIGTGVVLVITGIALAILIPRIDTSKEEFAQRKAAEKARAVAKNRARIMKAQAPKHGEAKALLPPAGASPEERDAARTTLLERVERDIFADARARAKTGEMHDVRGPTTCEHAPGTPTTGGIGVYDCFVITSKIPKGQRNPEGALGYPFRAVVNFKDFSYNWCKIEQVPGELMILSPKDITYLPPECQRP